MVFHCSGNGFISEVAAAVYLGRLAADRPPGDAQLLMLPHVRQSLGLRPLPGEGVHGGQLQGRLHVVGHDAYGHAVCVLGRGRHGALLQVVLTKAPHALKVGRAVQLVGEQLPDDKFSRIHIGAVLCRLHFGERLGRRLVFSGIRRRFDQLCRGVARVQLEVDMPRTL